ncbi:RNHCP domain-containing protein [Patescibacteria group bacterium]|nr:RNHCP domain-containing protein [Patescibacteria group bacterium]
MIVKRFTRKKEDFICNNCGYKVTGTGYTNHCPKCLWSLHVDINPGDRREKCKGMMEPVSVVNTPNGMKIIHKCTKCGYISKNTISAEDTRELVAVLSTNPAII